MTINSIERKLSLLILLYFAFEEKKVIFIKNKRFLLKFNKNMGLPYAQTPKTIF